MSRSSVFFIEPLDAFSNESILLYLSRNEFVAPLKILTSNNSYYDVYELSCRELKYIHSSSNSLNLKFRVYRKRGNGKAEIWDLYKRKKKSSKQKAIAQSVKQKQSST